MCKIRGAEVLHYFDGPVEIFGYVKDAELDFRWVYGRAIHDKTFDSEERTFECWTLPPVGETPFAVKEGEIEWTEVR